MLQKCFENGNADIETRNKATKKGWHYVVLKFVCASSCIISLQKFFTNDECDITEVFLTIHHKRGERQMRPGTEATFKQVLQVVTWNSIGKEEWVRNVTLF